MSTMPSPTASGRSPFDVSSAMAVVIAVHAPEPFRPRVKVIATPGGESLPTPYEVNLWEVPEEAQGPRTVKAPLDPAEHGVDPLLYL